MRIAVAAFLAAVTGMSPAWAQTAAPDGNGCEGVIARWQEFAAKENQGGFMDVSVFNKIQSEIDQATALCQSGQDAQASRMIEASKRRHGY